MSKASAVHDEVAPATPPTVSVTVDKTTVVVGGKVRFTTAYADADAQSVSFSVTGTDSRGLPATQTVIINVTDPVAISITNSKGYVATFVSDNGSVNVQDVQF